MITSLRAACLACHQQPTIVNAPGKKFYGAVKNYVWQFKLKEDFCFRY